ncbi:MAG: ferritin-like domain-containing protein [Acetobacteraceae bacterium]|nr:ferritin-like domain-containing protein [Acetobacteraceae bacterium]
MSQTTDTGTELFITGLRNQHAVENQAVSLLSRQVERLENYPEMEARMRQHIDESKVHAQRLEELLSQFGESHSSLKDAGLSFIGNMAAMAHTVAPDEVIKNTMANFAFEHYEIASYKSLLSLAAQIGQSGAESALKQSLQEEIAMAQWIDQHIGPTTLRFLELSRSGQKAGV